MTFSESTEYPGLSRSRCQGSFAKLGRVCPASQSFPGRRSPWPAPAAPASPPASPAALLPCSEILLKLPLLLLWLADHWDQLWKEVEGCHWCRLRQRRGHQRWGYNPGHSSLQEMRAPTDRFILKHSDP